MAHHRHITSRKISFGHKGTFQRFYRCLKLDEPRHCSFIRAPLVRFAQKLGAQSTLLNQSGNRFYKILFGGVTHGCLSHPQKSPIDYGLMLRFSVEIKREEPSGVPRTGEKRAILAYWASDAAAAASDPAFRELPGSNRIVTIDEVLEALSALDHGPKGLPGGKPARLRSTSGVAMAA
jgi:hypothetical protein